MICTWQTHISYDISRPTWTVSRCDMMHHGLLIHTSAMLPVPPTPLPTISPSALAIATSVFVPPHWRVSGHINSSRYAWTHVDTCEEPAGWRSTSARARALAVGSRHWNTRTLAGASGRLAGLLECHGTERSPLLSAKCKRWMRYGRAVRQLRDKAVIRAELTGTRVLGPLWSTAAWSPPL